MGTLASVDWAKEKSGDVAGEVEGNGRMVGPDMSARLSEHIYFDARLGWGRSDNTARQTIMDRTMRVISKPKDGWPGRHWPVPGISNTPALARDQRGLYRRQAGRL